MGIPGNEGGDDVVKDGDDVVKVVSDKQMWPTAPIEIFSKKGPNGRRVCRGELVFAEHALYFICHVDVSVFKANAGQAVGGLIGAAISAATDRSTKKKADAAEDGMTELALDEQLTENGYSQKWAPNEIDEFKKAFWSGLFFKAKGVKYPIRKLDKVSHSVIKIWCEEHKVQCKGYK